MKPIEKRKIADNTRKKILSAAKKLFAAHGFSGTTTLAIAKAAKVNEALLFHHFQNKINLWQHVKLTFLETINLAPLNAMPNTLADFLQKIVQQRLALYGHDPDLIKIMHWQQLESQQDLLTGTSPFSPKAWLEPIQYLQSQNKINKKIDPQFILYYLKGGMDAVIQDDKNREKHIKFLLQAWESSLSPDLYTN